MDDLRRLATSTKAIWPGAQGTISVGESRGSVRQGRPSFYLRETATHLIKLFIRSTYSRSTEAFFFVAWTAVSIAMLVTAGGME